MCGLSGALLHEPGLEAGEFGRRLARMARTLRHRGPDHEAVWTDGTVGLAHNRLSIIDRSPVAHQPMASAEGRVRVMSNGEIYNFRELRSELQSLGRRFRTRSDTEVVAVGYECWGTEIFQRLRGMFALAIWDGAARRLILARDRVGKKPLYVARARDAFLFGSEAKAILSWPGFPWTPDEEMLHRFLAFQYVPEPRSAFVGIERLAPGHFLTVGAGLDRRVERFASWPEPGSRPSGDAADQVAARVSDAVRARLVSDVPIGAFLSGGVDSSVVVATMAAELGTPLHTFSVGFEEPDFDERPFARAVASRYATLHHEVVVRPSDVSLLPKLAWHYGDPFGDSSSLPTYLLARAARAEVGVVLSGDGGDELFLGYDSYRWHAANAWAETLPAGLRAAAAWADARYPERPGEGRARRILRRCMRRLDVSAARRHMRFMNGFRPVDRAFGYGERLARWRTDNPFDALAPWFDQAPDTIAGASWCDFNTYLPQDILVKVDVATMANGLEARAPLLDQELVSWAGGLSSAERLPGGRAKGLLLDAFASRLPQEIVNRPKRGFAIPIEAWLRGPWYEPMRADMTSDRARSRGLYAPGFVERLLDEHRTGTALHHPRLWSMWMLELWFRCWLDRGTAAALEGPAPL